MKSFLLLVVLIFVSAPVISQDEFQKFDIDSVQNVLKMASEDTNRVKAALFLHDKLRFSDFTKAAQYADTAYQISTRINWKKGIALAGLSLGTAYSLTARTAKAQKLLMESVALAKEVNDKSTEANCYMTLGNIQYDKTNYAEALPLYILCYETYKSIENHAGMSAALIWIGIIYQYSQKDYSLAISTYKEAERMADLGKSTLNKGYILTNLATIYYQQEEYDSAIHYYTAGNQIKEAFNDVRGLANGVNNIANCYYELGQYPKASKSYNAALQLRKSISDSTGICSSYVNIGKVEMELENLERANELFEQAKDIAVRIDYKEAIQQSFLFLSMISERKKNYAEALDHFKNYKTISDSIFNLSSDGILSELKTKYETEQKEQQIALQQAEIAEQQAQNQRNIIFIAGLIAIIVLLIVIALLTKSKLQKKQIMLQQAAEIKLRETQIEATISSQEKERSRFAKDLHDGFGQMISILNLNLKSLADGDKDRHTIFDRSTKVLEEMYQELKSICFNLMPQTLVQHGLAPAIREFAGRINATGKVFVTTDVFGLEERLTEVQEISLYRITQEWVNNILKYSDADKVTIQVTRDEAELTLLIEDNGTGFSLDLLRAGKGHGWRNMQTRVNLIKGELELDTTPGIPGNTLIINAPVVSYQMQTTENTLLRV